MDHFAQVSRLRQSAKTCNAKRLVVGVDASRNRSGGARAHLVGILSELQPEKHGISEVHVWAYAALLDLIPDRPWLIKHAPKALERSLLHQLAWQAFELRSELQECQCDIVFATDASTLCYFSPMVVLSQDLLSYEPSVMSQFGWGYQRIRLLAILWLQNMAFRRSGGVIFLTKYAGFLIQRSCGQLSSVAYVPHGVEDIFKKTMLRPWPKDIIRCLYVSPVIEYKHHRMVVEAIAQLRQRGHILQLILIGGGERAACDDLNVEISRVDPGREWITQHGAVAYEQLPVHLASADIFIFASSCETFGITLLEAMSVGLPIACSNRSSLPETLEDGGVYFDPEIPDSIATAVETIIFNEDIRIGIARQSKYLASQYTWQRCADETFKFIADTAAKVGQT